MVSGFGSHHHLLLISTCGASFSPGTLPNGLCAIPIWTDGKSLTKKQGWAASSLRSRLGICLILCGYFKLGDLSPQVEAENELQLERQQE